MSKSPAFQFYPKDWLSDSKIMLMDWECRGMHIHLLCIAWFQDLPGTLPNDDEQIMRFLGMSTSKNSSFIRYETKLKNNVLANFTLDENLESLTYGRLVHDGLSAEYIKQKLYRERQKSNIEKRWNPIPRNDSGNTRSIPGGYSAFATAKEDIKNISSKEKREKRKTQFPQNFCVTDRHVELALLNRWPPPSDELEAFRDWHVSKGSVMANWDSAFYTWLRRAKQYGENRGSGNGRRKSNAEHLVESCKGALRGTKYDPDVINGVFSDEGSIAGEVDGRFVFEDGSDF